AGNHEGGRDQQKAVGVIMAGSGLTVLRHRDLINTISGSEMQKLKAPGNRGRYGRGDVNATGYQV
ncbi:hypothetical protein, partial [Klebsiella pneumoniae]|uniref:hypothetical protein n=1 Tax=Klebsiella pneumoniae TaxID=573 RepID=UPI00197AB978